VKATGRDSTRPDYIETLARAEQVIRWLPDPEPPPLQEKAAGPLQVGVDLGTAYLVLAVLNQNGQPLAGEYQFAQVVRDGLVVDYLGAIDLLVEMKSRVEGRLGRELTQAASGYPPGVPTVEVRAMANVIEAAGLRCSSMVDEPSAANAVLKLQDGAIVDVGGGTTGIAILEKGKVVYTADEATGGTHFSLVVAGAEDIPFEAAEELKVNPAEQKRLFPIVRPVMEKVGDIVSRHVRISQVEVKELTLVGGTSNFPGMADVVAEYTGLPTWVPRRPEFVTPVGIAMNDTDEQDWEG
jgi:ethanolamine utilization protein EutJ